METFNRLSYLKMRCSNMVIMKECKYLETIKGKPFENIKKSPLKIRDSLYGGRTCAAVLYKDCYEKGKIHYVDFVSLYPSVQFEEFYPVGEALVVIDHEIIEAFIETEMEKDGDERLCGFLKCEILPPNDLMFPVLPLRLNNKLLFPLCFACAESKNHDATCDHEKKERCLRGTWCLHEVYKAMECGYEIVQNHELIYYEKKMKIFENYISKFYCLKTQYSGVNKGSDPDYETARKNLSNFLLEKYGIFVKWEEIPIERNETMRYVMKLILNSLWGKLCQNPNKSSVHFVNDYEELLSYVTDNKYESVHFDVLNCNVARVVCNYKEDYNDKVNKVCVSVGSYITCYSRLKLLNVLLKLPFGSVLYYDTDSIIYYSEYMDELINVETDLGKLSSELGHNEHITSFVSTGPKSYSFKTNKGVEVTHVKGFKLKRNNEVPVNPDYLYELIENRNAFFDIEDRENFHVNKQLHIFKNSTSKRLSFTFDKRKILEDLTTVPWGYKT